MSKIDFPNNPTTGEIYEYAGQKWRWDGKSWNSVSSSNLSSIDITEYQLKDQLQGTVIGDLVPLGDGTINLGSLNKKFKNLYLDGNSFFFGNSTIIEVNGDILLDPNNSGSSVKLNISDISELSDNNNLLGSGGGSGVDLDQVDSHLNLDSAGEGQVLSYTGGDYQWIDPVAGPAGADGADGSDGLSAYEIANVNGVYDSAGEWLASLQGADGAAGQNGTDGSDGAGIESVVDNGNGTLTISYGGGQQVVTSDLTGPAGADGTDGQDGATGPAGPAGPPGVDGVDGASFQSRTVTISSSTGTSKIVISGFGDITDLNAASIDHNNGGSNPTQIEISSLGNFKISSISFYKDSNYTNSNSFSILYPEINGKTDLTESVMPNITPFGSSGAVNSFGIGSFTISNSSGVMNVFNSSASGDLWWKIGTL